MKVISCFYVFLLLLLFSNCVYAQQNADTLQPKKDTGLIATSDTSLVKADTFATGNKPVIKSYYYIIDSLLLSNRFIDIKRPAVFYISEKKQMQGKEFTFYALCVIVLILGVFKTFYSGYFNNLFRVFFNTSIRQTQLTDQLLQAKLPSFILNIFFTITTGFYLWLLFKYYHPLRFINKQLFLPVCVLGIGILYFVKYCILKFIGWMSGMQAAADNYIFVIFLINKIIGIILIPFIIILAFANSYWINPVAIFSLLLLGFFFLLRYIKTYGVLEYKFPLEPFHFIIYITALEIVPLLIIYKAAVDYLV